MVCMAKACYNSLEVVGDVKEWRLDEALPVPTVFTRLVMSLLS